MFKCKRSFQQEHAAYNPPGSSGSSLANVGAMAMAGGQFMGRETLCVSWPTGEFGGGGEGEPALFLAGRASLPDLRGRHLRQGGRGVGGDE